MTEKQCGFLDQKGGFHKTLHKCNNANMQYEIRNLQESISNLNSSYSRRFANKFDHIKIDSRQAQNVSALIDKIFIELLVGERGWLLEYSDKIIELEARRNALVDREGLPKILRKDWWLREYIDLKQE